MFAKASSPLPHTTIVNVITTLPYRQQPGLVPTHAGRAAIVAATVASQVAVGALEGACERQRGLLEGAQRALAEQVEQAGRRERDTLVKVGWGARVEA